MHALLLLAIFKYCGNTKCHQVDLKIDDFNVSHKFIVYKIYLVVTIKWPTLLF